MDHERFRLWRSDPSTQEVLRALMVLGENYKANALESQWGNCLQPNENGALQVAYAFGVYEMAHFLKTCNPEELFSDDQAEDGEASRL